MYVQNQKSVPLFNRKHYGRAAYYAAKAVYVGAMLVRAGLGHAGPAGARGPAPGQAGFALRFHLLGTSLRNGRSFAETQSARRGPRDAIACGFTDSTARQPAP